MACTKRSYRKRRNSLLAVRFFYAKINLASRQVSIPHLHMLFSVSLQAV